MNEAQSRAVCINSFMSEGEHKREEEEKKAEEKPHEVSKMGHPSATRELRA